MTKLLAGTAVVMLALAGRASAGTMFGALSNFDAVNDTGSPCNGFEIELDDVTSRDVTYTFEFQRYGVPKIVEDTFQVNGASHPRTFVRWMSPYDQVNHVFTQATPVAPLGFKNTGGHLCYKNMTVNGQPYDTAGCEHFGVGTLTNPTNAVYRWMKEDSAAPGTLVALGNPVTIPAPVWSVNPVVGAPPVVAAVVPVPPPPAVVPVPYLPDAEFGVAAWVKVFETEAAGSAELGNLVADDPAVPGNLGPTPNPSTVTEIEWQILQTDKMNPSANELKSERQMGVGNESVTRRYEFYKYVGPYDINSPDGANTGTNEALCATVGGDGTHGGPGSVTIYDANGTPSTLECSTTIVVGEYIGSQNAAANIAMPLSANGANLVHGDVGVRYPDRPLIFGGSGGPYSVTFSGGTLPATDPGNEFALDSTTGILKGGIPNGAGTATFTVHASDLGDPTQSPLDATFNVTVDAAAAAAPTPTATNAATATQTVVPTPTNVPANTPTVTPTAPAPPPTLTYTVPPTPTVTSAPTATLVATSTRVPSPTAAVAPKLEDHDGCQVGPRAPGVVPWLLLIPVMLLRRHQARSGERARRG